MSEFFPWWVVITHFLNIVLMLMLFRSGIEVLSAFPKPYWHDDCPPGRQWLLLWKKLAYFVVIFHGVITWFSLRYRRRTQRLPGAPLPIEHGAPIRLRVETQLGFKMVKWVQGIEFVTDTADIGMGMGGWREDQQFYANAAGI